MKVLVKYLRWLVIASIFFSTLSALGQTSYEAESAWLTIGARVTVSDFCSNQKQVSGIGDKDNGQVLFDKIEVDKDGLYELTVCYITGDDRSFTIQVNDELPIEKIFHTKAGGKGVSTQMILIPLHKGVNTLSFNNPDEGAPGLDRILISKNPVQSYSISGIISSKEGNPLSGVNVLLHGECNRETFTDANGRYVFNALPKGRFEIIPGKSGMKFTPCSQLVEELSVDKHFQFFNGEVLVQNPEDIISFQNGSWKIEYNTKLGNVSVYFKNIALIREAYSVVKIPVAISSLDYASHKATHTEVNDSFGEGTKYEVRSTALGLPDMVQTFWLYNNADDFFTDVRLESEQAISSNYMAPLVSNGKSSAFPEGDNRSLFVPFDNDKWVRYNAYPFGNTVTSYEVSAWYNNNSRDGIVIGSVEHDKWKTGIRSETTANSISKLEVFGGITGTKTRDVLSHGKITGQTIRSPKIFVGYFSDWRKGLETYACANATIKPARKWEKGKPFGWNSWGKIQFGINFDKAVEVSDFFVQKLQPNHFENDSIVYIGLDSGWDHLSDDQLKKFVDHCKANHQEAGIYFGPFTAWGNDGDRIVEGSSFKYEEVYLYANGKRQFIDGGIAVDPTHPAIKKRIEHYVDRFKKAGFKFLKIDFLVHGALEADHYYNPNVTTGMQAFNEGMQFFLDAVGNEMYINEAISPLFPAHYVHSRRIGCDSWGAIDQTEYSLNALTYGWWLDKVYAFNDVDHVVFDCYSEAENRSRLTSSAVTGIYILGDDFSKSGNLDGKDRVLKYATNDDINRLARIKDSFRPVDGNTGNKASGLFEYEDNDFWYIVAYNYSDQTITRTVDCKRLGISLDNPLEGKELWSGEKLRIGELTSFDISPRDVKVFRINKK